MESLPSLEEVSATEYPFSKLRKTLETWVHDSSLKALENDEDNFRQIVASLKDKIPGMVKLPEKPIEPVLPEVPRFEKVERPTFTNERIEALREFQRRQIDEIRKQKTGKKLSKTLKKKVQKVEAEVRKMIWDETKNSAPPELLQPYLNYLKKKKEAERVKRLNEAAQAYYIANRNNYASLYARLLRLRERCIPLKVLERIEREFEDRLEGKFNGIGIEKLNWDPLPPGILERGDTQAIARAAKLDRHPNFEKQRLDFAYKLKPSKVYVGLNEFEGYLVFLYPETNRALLENPLVGNAAFILKDNWVQLSKLSRTELNRYYKSDAIRVVHGKVYNWKRKIRDALLLKRGQRRHLS